MKHIKTMSQQSLPAPAQSSIVCGYLFVPTFTKCVDSNSPLAGILKDVAVP